MGWEKFNWVIWHVPVAMCATASAATGNCVLASLCSRLHPQILTRPLPASRLPHKRAPPLISPPSQAQPTTITTRTHYEQNKPEQFTPH